MNANIVHNTPIEYLIYKVTILKKTFLLISGICIIGFFFSKSFSLGFLVGGVLSMANFSLLAKYIVKMRNFSINKAKRYIAGKFLIIYCIMGITLFISATKGMIVFTATALGLLAVKATIFFNKTAKYVKPA